MSFQDEKQAEQVEQAQRRGPGRPKKNGAVAEASPTPSVTKAVGDFDREARWEVTIREVEGGHHGPVWLHTGGEKNGKPHDERATLLPERPKVISGTLYAKLKGAVVDERGPDLDANLSALNRGEETIEQYDEDGRLKTRSKRRTGSVKNRFFYEARKVG